jgi:hypothetical protein
MYTFIPVLSVILSIILVVDMFNYSFKVAAYVWIGVLSQEL